MSYGEIVSWRHSQEEKNPNEFERLRNDVTNPNGKGEKIGDIKSVVEQERLEKEKEEKDQAREMISLKIAQEEEETMRRADHLWDMNRSPKDVFGIESKAKQKTFSTLDPKFKESHQKHIDNSQVDPEFGNILLQRVKKIKEFTRSVNELGRYDPEDDTTDGHRSLHMRTDGFIPTPKGEFQPNKTYHQPVPKKYKESYFAQSDTSYDPKTQPNYQVQTHQVSPKPTSIQKKSLDFNNKRGNISCNEAPGPTFPIAGKRVSQERILSPKSNFSELQVNRSKDQSFKSGSKKYFNKTIGGNFELEALNREFALFSKKKMQASGNKNSIPVNFCLGPTGGKSTGQKVTCKSMINTNTLFSNKKSLSEHV